MKIPLARSKVGNVVEYLASCVATVRSQPFLISPANAKLLDSGITERVRPRPNKDPPRRSSVARCLGMCSPARSAPFVMRLSPPAISPSEKPSEARARVLRARGKVSHRHDAHVEGDRGGLRPWWRHYEGRRV